MDKIKDFNQDEIHNLIQRELEDDLNDDKNNIEINGVKYFIDEAENISISDKQSVTYSLIINNSNNPNNNYIELTSFNNFSDINNNPPQIQINNKRKIFNIEKVPRQKIKKLGGKIFRIKKSRQKKHPKRQIINWNTIEVPKEKYFNLDRIKHRIIFQRKHLKVIYSLIGLSPPINFKKCFELIKNHIGDKTLQNFGKVKSFHIIRKNGNEKIVTLMDKKFQMKKLIFVNKRIDNQNNE